MVDGFSAHPIHVLCNKFGDLPVSLWQKFLGIPAAAIVYGPLLCIWCHSVAVFASQRCDFGMVLVCPLSE
jgi:hypothetical protein